MLPLIGALAGSALGPAAFGTTALLGSAVGSGLGSYLQTGSLERGLMTGIGSYFGGKLLGGIGGDKAAMDPTAAKEAAKAGAASGVTPMASPEYLSSPLTSADLAAPGALPPGGGVMKPTSLPGLGGPGYTPPTPQTTSLFDTPISDTQLGRSISGAFGEGAKVGGADLAKQTVGEAAKQSAITGTIGSALSYEPPAVDTGFGDDEPVEIPDYGPEDYAKQRTPGEGYRPGRDPEFRYFDRSGTSSLTRGLTGMASGGIMRMQEGGEINDKEVVDMAIRAVEGKIAEPEKALAEYMNRFGQEALLSLVNAVRSGEIQSSAGPAEGMVRGAGDGMEDLVPASMGEQDVLLSEGEFVVPADVVSGIGNGSTDAGAERLYGMLDRVREMRNGGSTKQPPQIRAMDALPA